MTKQRVSAVILDEGSFNPGDLDLSGFSDVVNSLTSYPETAPDQVVSRLAKAQVAIANKVVFDQAVIEALPHLALILLTATGTDNVDLSACAEHGVAVANVTDYCTASVAQHALSMLLSLSTRQAEYAKASHQKWPDSAHFSILQYPIQELSGKTLGVVGYGVLGKAFARLAEALGMHVLVSARMGQPVTEGRVALHDLLPQVDVLSLHCPLTPNTRHMLSTEQFKTMRSTAILLNTARGALIDNAALALALSEGQIAGAGIDVLDQEPPPADHPLLLLEHDQLIITPHVAWAAKEARQRLVTEVIKNLKAWQAGDARNRVESNGV